MPLMGFPDCGPFRTSVEGTLKNVSLVAGNNKFDVLDVEETI